MKLTANLKAVTSLVAWAATAAEKRTSIPVLEHAHLEARDGRLAVACTNLEIHHSGAMAAEVMTPGAALVPAAKLASLLKAADGENVTLELLPADAKEPDAGGRLRVAFGHGTYHLATLDVTLFPEPPALADPVQLRWDAEALDKAIATVMPTISTDDTRFNLCCALFEPLKGEAAPLRMASTDGHRLTVQDCRPVGAEALPKSPQILLPRDGLLALRTLLRGAGEVVAEFTGQHIAITRDERRVMVRLNDGNNFPQYRVVIPKANKIVATVQREALRTALRRASLMATRQTLGVRMEFDREHLRITGGDGQTATAEEVLDIALEGADSAEIALNNRYLLDVCDVMTSEQIRLALDGDHRNPATITGEGDPGLLLVLMPVRI